MPARTYIEEDFVAVRSEPRSDAPQRAMLVFGDPVEVLGESDGWTEVRVLNRFEGGWTGYVRGALPTRDAGVLSLSMVDVQQGDGLILETPTGKVVFIDGGDNQLFARHAAARLLYHQTSAEAPLDVEAIIVTHGDADHFDGLNDIVRSETDPEVEERQRLFIRPKRVYHNGLVKGPTEGADGRRIPDEDVLGRTVEVKGHPHVIDLYDDPDEAPEARRNGPFKRWVRSLGHWRTRGDIELRRVAFGMDESDLFGFLHAEGIGVEV